MKYLASLMLVLTIAQATPVKRSDAQGIAIGPDQTNIDWPALKAQGIEFVYIQATGGIGYISPEFPAQWKNATDAGIIRGAYHFAIPDASDGATQAEFFLENGGRWVADGQTLPGVLDIEYNPEGSDCYDLTASDMVSWIKDFSDTYNRETGRPPVIYTTTDWWVTCTGNNADFGNNPLWIAHYDTTPYPIPAGWADYSFWQYASTGPNPSEADVYNGSYDDLKKFALGG